MNSRRAVPHERVKALGSMPEASPKSGRDRVGFEFCSDEFKRMICGEEENLDPLYEIVVEADCFNLNAHEAAVFLEHGVETGDESFDNRPTLLFTTQPFFEEEEGRGGYAVAIKGVTLDTLKTKTLHRSRNLANGGTLGMDGRLYFCFQGAKVESESSEIKMFQHPAGVSSVDPKDWSDWRVEVDGWGPNLVSFNSPNDVVISRKSGSVFFTDPSYAAAQGYGPPAALGDWVWRYDPWDNTVSVVADNFSKPNGLCFSPDESKIYVTDTGYVVGDGTQDRRLPRTIYVFDVEHKKKQLLTNRRLLYVADSGVPDGIKVDSNGIIYTGCADGVHVVHPDTGALLGKVLIIGNDGGAANLCFGRGKYSNTLYILAEAAIVALTFQDNNTYGAQVGHEGGEGKKNTI